MEQYYVLVGLEGEITIPEAFCDSLGIVDGTRLGNRVNGDRIILTPETPAAEQSAVKE